MKIALLGNRGQFLMFLFLHTCHLYPTIWYLQLTYWYFRLVIRIENRFCPIWGILVKKCFINWQPTAYFILVSSYPPSSLNKANHPDITVSMNHQNMPSVSHHSKVGAILFLTNQLKDIEGYHRFPVSIIIMTDNRFRSLWDVNNRKWRHHLIHLSFFLFGREDLISVTVQNYSNFFALIDFSLWGRNCDGFKVCHPKWKMQSSRLQNAHLWVISHRTHFFGVRLDLSANRRKRNSYSHKRHILPTCLSATAINFDIIRYSTVT